MTSVRRGMIAGAIGGLAALLTVHFVLAHTYWDYSEGVYAMSARLMLHGHRLYGQLVGAQPPGVFVVGAGVLFVHDGLEWLRLAIAGLQLLAGLVAAAFVWRLTASRLATALTVPAALLTPWAVHEHGALTPELVALPVLMGAAWLSREARHARLAGVLCGVLPLIKVPFVIPALALLACSPVRGRAAAWALGTLTLGAGATTLVGGVEVWRDAVYAQTQSGYRSLSLLKGFWAQAGWNLICLLVPAAVALRLQAAVVDRRALRVSIVLAAAMVATFFTNLKQGTGLNITVSVELALLPLAAAGITLAARRAQGFGQRPAALACAAAVGLGLAQTASLLVAPHHPQPFLRLGSRQAWAVVMDGQALRAAVAQARRCPPAESFGGPPLIAFVAGRRMRGNQPDQFIVTRAPALRSVRLRVGADQPVCPFK